MPTLTLEDKTTVYEYDEGTMKSGEDNAYCDVYAPVTSKNNEIPVALKILRKKLMETLEKAFMEAGENNKTKIVHTHFLSPQEVGTGTDENDKRVAYWILAPAKETLLELLIRRFPTGQTEDARKTAVSDPEWVRGTYYYLLNALDVVKTIEDSDTVKKYRIDVKESNTLIMDEKEGIFSFMIADPIPLSRGGTTTAGNVGRAQHNNSNVGFRSILETAYWMLTGYCSLPDGKKVEVISEISPLVSKKLIEKMAEYYHHENPVDSALIAQCINDCKEAIEKNNFPEEEKERVPYFGVIQQNGAYLVLSPAEYFRVTLKNGGEIEIPEADSGLDRLTECYGKIKERNKLMKDTQEMLESRGIMPAQKDNMTAIAQTEQKQMTAVYENIQAQMREIQKKKDSEIQQLQKEAGDIKSMLENDPVKT